MGLTKLEPTVEVSVQPKENISGYVVVLQSFYVLPYSRIRALRIPLGTQVNDRLMVEVNTAKTMPVLAGLSV
jgi:hypothetical protein